MKKFTEFVEEARQQIDEIFPWDVNDIIQQDNDTLIIDIREECEFSSHHIERSWLIPRGILETACEYDYEDSVPELVEARERDIIVICRSGNRSLLAALTMKMMGIKTQNR